MWRVEGLGSRGRGDLGSMFTTPMGHLTTPVIPHIRLLTKSA